MSIRKNFKHFVQSSAIYFAAVAITFFVRLSPEKNFNRVLNVIGMLSAQFGNPKPFKGFMGWLSKNPGTKQWFIKLMLKNRGQASNVIKILFGNCSLKWIEKSRELEPIHGFTSPYGIMFSPTMRCNLKCKGCYALDYQRGEDMDNGLMESIVKQGKDLGTYFYTILGGEPFVRFEDIAELAFKHNDCIFQIFTNGTLITDEIADKIAELKNIIVVFSVNGDKNEVDYMRGEGVYEKMISSINRLNSRNLIMGMSMVLTSRNFEQMTRASFYQEWQQRGILFGWNFLFMPVIKNTDLSLMPSAEQRVEYGEFLQKYREQYPLFLMDFWADAPAVHGCAAGGRRYLHINHKGEVEPCIFAHFSTHNIKEHSLLDVLKSPFFTGIRQHQPHTDNLLRPCMIIDNPEVLRSLCKKHNAKPTAKGAEALIEDQEFINHIDSYSHEVAVKADELWKEKYQSHIDGIIERGNSYPEGLDRISYRLDRISYLQKIIDISNHDQAYAARTLEEASEAFEKYEKNEKLHSKIDDHKDSGKKDFNFVTSSHQ